MENETVTTSTESTNLVDVNSLPKSGTLTSSDIRKWVEQTILYSVAIPVLLVVLTSLQNGLDLKTASFAGYYAFISAVLNLLVKYSKGV